MDRVLLLALVLLAAPALHAQESSIDAFPGTFTPRGINMDGSIVFGNGTIPGAPAAPAYRWNDGAYRTLPIAVYSTAINGTHYLAYGTFNGNTGYFRVIVNPGGIQVQRLVDLVSDPGLAAGVPSITPDGTRVYGAVPNPSGAPGTNDATQAAVWTAAGPPSVRLPPPSDGQCVLWPSTGIFVSTNTDAFGDAYLFSCDAGMPGIFRSVHVRWPGAEVVPTNPLSIRASGDGALIVRYDSEGINPVRGSSSITPPPTDQGCQFSKFSFDGGSAVGGACYWRADLGWVRLLDLLAERGVDVSEWSDATVSDVSGDNRVVTGTATYQGATVGFRAVIGGPVAGLVVNAADDDADETGGSGTCDTGDVVEVGGEVVPECTLRAAIETANARGGAPIAFDIQGPSQRIVLTGVLPAATHPTTIGTDGDLVELDGGTTVATGLRLLGDDSGVAGVAFFGFVDGGLELRGDRSYVRACRFGADWTETYRTNPTAALRIGSSAVFVSGDDAIVGGATPVPGTERGTLIVGSGTGITLAGANGVRVQGNAIGFAGHAIAGAGIEIASSASDVRIGGSTASGEDNEIVAVGGYGIDAFFGEHDGLIVQGNTITGSALDGFRVAQGAAALVRIGGTADEGNTLHDNTGAGIRIAGDDGAGPGAPRVRIEGNRTYENGGGGIRVAGGHRVWVGADAPAPGTAPGNRVDDGVELLGTANSHVAGNRIGNDIPTTTALPASLRIDGVQNTVGGPGGAGNRLDGTASLVTLGAPALLDAGFQTRIENNLVGTNGSASFGAAIGIDLRGDGAIVVGNVVAGNDGDGVRVETSGTATLLGNRIGVLPDGAVLANGDAGVHVVAGTVQIGDLRAGTACGDACNVISGNAGPGIYFEGGSGSTVLGNAIGVLPDGATAVGNLIGLVVEADGVTIGGPSGAITGVCDGPCNVIAGNFTGPGIQAYKSGTLAGGGLVEPGSDTDGMTVQGNVIGRVGAPNRVGVALGGSGNANVVGAVVGQADGTRGNLIAGNSHAGVVVYGSSTGAPYATGNTIRDNRIFDNLQLGGTAPIDLNPGYFTAADDGPTPDDASDADAGPNDLLNTPSLVASRPRAGEASLLVLWTGDRTAAPASYRLDVYSNPACLGYTAEARTRVAAQTVTLPRPAAERFDTLSVTVPLDAAQPYIAATFTDAAGSTSELGNCLRADAAQTVVVASLQPGVQTAAAGLLATLNATALGASHSASRGGDLDVIVARSALGYGGDRFEATAAASPDGTPIVPQSTVGGLWHVAAPGGDGALADVCLDADALSPGDAARTVVLARSASTGGLWRPFATRLETVGGVRYACAADVALAGQVALGSGEAAALAAPALVSPADGAANVAVQPTLAWSPVPMAEAYDVQVALGTGFESVLHAGTGVAGTSWAPPELPGGAPLSWRVRAVASGAPGPWSAAWRFTTVAPPVATEDGAPPAVFALSAPFPNPARGAVTVAFETPEASAVRVEVFDVAGRRVAVLVDETLAAGRHRVTLAASPLPAGVYVVRMAAGSFAAVRRITVVR